MNSTPNPAYPQHWELLSDTDKEVYRRISTALSAPSSRNKRNKRINDFREILDAIEIFINSNEADRWKRCLVCGVCRLTDGIAVNVPQLKKLIFKCKSSINGALKGLGYDIVVAKTASCPELLRLIPVLRNCPTELRQWTIRICSAKQQQPVEATPPVATEKEHDGMAVDVDGWVKM
jgi:hypothetical protein